MTSRATLLTKNTRGLTSAPARAGFFVDFVEPVSPVITALTPVPSAGGINVTVGQAAAVGAQPLTASLEIWHRPVTSLAVINANPYFESAATDWTGVGGSAARSTTRAHQGTASLLCTPNGSTPVSGAQTALYPVVQNVAYEARAWLYPTTANKPLRLALAWYDAGAALISESRDDVSSVAGTWLYASVVATPPVGATQVRVLVGEYNTPAAGDTFWADELTLILGNLSDGVRIQTDVAAGVPVLDWRVNSGLDYEWRARATGVNGTSTFGPWQA
jgi:hypothetical protein